MGNHEYGTSGLVPAAQSNFKKLAGVKSLWYTKVIKGYRFIVLAADTRALNNFGNLTSAQIRWFKNTMASAAKSANGKPIFVVSHYSLKTGNMAETIGSVVTQYDNVVMLWGHSHCKDYKLNEACYYYENVMCARMGSVHYYDMDINFRCANADALVVRVYNDHYTLQIKRAQGTVLNPDTLSIKYKYTVNFYDENGELLKTQTVNYGEDATAPKLAQKDGYKASWDCKFKNVTKTLNVHAVYTAV